MSDNVEDWAKRPMVVIEDPRKGLFQIARRHDGASHLTLIGNFDGPDFLINEMVSLLNWRRQNPGLDLTRPVVQG